MSDEFPEGPFAGPRGGALEGDPVRKSQELMRRNLTKRFYKDVTVELRDEGHVVLLDGRQVKTPGKVTLALPDARLAEAVAAEWRAQKTHIDPGVMHLTRIVNSGIEAVPAKHAEVADDIAGYAGTDLLCYRAQSPERLVLQQARHWDPVLAWAEETFGARFILAGGVMHVAQPPHSLEAIRAAVRAYDSLHLAALHTATTLTGSVLLALALTQGHLTPDAVWAAAFVDENWNAELWGADAEALQTRALKRQEFDAAAFVLGIG
ncbi:ATP12 family protein [Breoghania sp. L-A4]|uniref:ATP12 family chaperone protein n=1 Tax=Breoghania sp. L-A4 TaxID=2304600 RepID=UPI000E359F91|nr:ATP12 family protein [Breoghania sp. L-A4]AXS40858.1 ATPase [Breoghania sp. L-A4]